MRPSERIIVGPQRRREPLDHGRVAVAGAALGEATEAEINFPNRGIAKPLLPRPPRRGTRTRRDCGTRTRRVVNGEGGSYRWDETKAHASSATIGS